MQMNLLKGKLHRGTTTHAELDYEGSCAIDRSLLEAAGIREYEQIHIYNVANGKRFVTYAIVAEAGSGTISVNGAAAHLAKPGDLLIICAFVQMDEAEAARHKPQLVYVNDANEITNTRDFTPEQAA